MIPNLRVLYVIDSLAPGGAETSLAAMAPHLVARGIDLHVLPLGPALDLAPDLRVAGASVHLRHTRPGRLGNYRQVVAAIRTVRPALVHTTLYEADVAGRLAARRMRVPVVSSIVSDSYGPSHYEEVNKLKLDLAKLVDLLTARLVTRFHAVSRAAAETVGPRLRIGPERIDVIPRGRDPARFPYLSAGLRAATRAELGIDDDRPVVLAVGRLELAKGFGDLLTALPEVALTHSDAVVLIAGRDGRSADSLRAAAKDAPLEVRFLGHRTDVAGLLAAADVFCFPSHREGFSGALLEAMAAGCPIVASAIPPSVEALGSSRESAGLLVPPEDPEALGNALRHLLGDMTLRRQLADRGAQRFREKFALQSIAAMTAEWYKWVAQLGSKPYQASPGDTSGPAAAATESDDPKRPSLRTRRSRQVRGPGRAVYQGSLVPFSIQPPAPSE